MWVPQLLLPPKIIRMFDLKSAFFSPKYAFLGTFGTQLVGRKTPIKLYLKLRAHLKKSRKADCKGGRGGRGGEGSTLTVLA